MRKLFFLLMIALVMLTLACNEAPVDSPDHRLVPVVRPGPTADTTQLERLQNEVRELETEMEALRQAVMATSVPTSTPSVDVRRSPVSGDICQRSPAIQNALISRLNIPSCRLITGGELLRITALAISAKELWSGDLDGLYNVDNLNLSLQSPPPPDLLADLERLVDLSLSFQSSDGPWEATGYFPPLPKLLALSVDVGVVSEGSEGMVVAAGTFAGMPELAGVSLEGVRELEAGAFLEVVELKQLDLKAYEYNVSGMSIDERPSLPPGLLEPLAELEEISAQGFRWPFAEGLELYSYEQVCRIGFNFRGYNPSDYPLTPYGLGQEMRLRVDGQPVGLLASDTVGGGRVCRVGTGPSWPEANENGVVPEWEMEHLVDLSE